MNHETFEDNGAHLGVYFILDESRSEPPMRRAHLILDACHLLKDSSEPQNELYGLANDLLDCEQEIQRLIGTLQCDNAEKLASGGALSFLLVRLERSPFDAKLKLLGNYRNLGLLVKSPKAFLEAYMKAYSHLLAHQQRFDLFMFRLRTRHWARSNADSLAEFTAEKQKTAAAPAA